MPMFNTGNQAWDQGLNTLGSSLFPDPSRVAQAGYYGAEMRNAQMQAAKTQDQLAAMHRFQMMQGGDTAPPPLTYAPAPGVNMPPVLQDPSLTQPPAAPPPPAPSGPTQPAPAGPPLSTPPGPGGAPISGLFQGKPPPQSQDGSNGPVTSNATGSDGTLPAGGDPVSGIFHPGSLTPPNGGIKMSGPAAPNGSPAPLAVSPAQYVAAAVAAGMDASQAKLQGTALAGSLFQRGVISRDMYHQILGSLGESAMGVEDVASQTSIKTAGIAAGATLGAERMRVAEQGREFDQGQVQYLGPNNTPMQTTRANLPATTNVYDPRLVEQGRTLVPTQPGGAGTATILRPQSEAAGAQAPVTPEMGGGYGHYIDPANPTSIITATASDAASRNLHVVPAGSDQQQAMWLSAYQNAKTPQDRQALLDIQQSAQLPKPVEAAEANRQAAVNYQNDQRMYAQPQTGLAATGAVTYPPALTQPAQDLVNQETYRLQMTVPRFRNDASAAHTQAMTNLQAQGKITTPDQVNAARGGIRAGITSAGLQGDPRILMYAPPGATQPTPHMKIDVTQPPAAGSGTVSPTVGPGTGGPTPAGGPPVAGGGGPRLSAVVAPQPPPTPPRPAFTPGAAPLPMLNPNLKVVPMPQNMPPTTGPGGMQTFDTGAPAPGQPPATATAQGPQPIGPAPAGARDGQVLYGNKGTRAIVRNGQLWPMG